MENLWIFAPDTAAKMEQLPKYLLDLLEEANKPKPNPKIWQHEDWPKFDSKGNIDYKEKPVNRGIFSQLFHNETYKTGRYKCLGWVFDFSKSWKNYLVYWKSYDTWMMQKAPNKTFIRKHSCHPSDIKAIIELDVSKKKAFPSCTLKAVKDFEEENVINYINIIKLSKKLIKDLKNNKTLPKSYYELEEELKNIRKIK